MNNTKKLPRHLIAFLILIFSICSVLFLMYKTQFRSKLHKPVQYTMMTTHKPNGSVDLSKDSPILTETFTCKVPQLQQFTLSCKAQDKSSSASLFVTLQNADSGEIYYQGSESLSGLKATKAKQITCKLSEPAKDSENASLQLKLELADLEDTVLTFTANEKQALIQEFGGNPDSHTNVIYSLSYGNNDFMLRFYAGVCIAILLFAALTFYLLMIRRLSVQKFFIPIGLFLGLLIQCLITVHGVPDEPTHIDAAYKYSNQILFIKNPDTPGTIYKRTCDAELTDMLSNGLESNSYYQLLFHSFEQPENTELIPVSYSDTSALVPGIVYIPAAIGISVGRLLRLSPMLTYQLGRICSLIAFLLLVQFAICIAPFGKNLLAGLALLPITLQQAASASYDSVIIGLIFVYTALCFYFSKTRQRQKRYLILLAFLSLFIAIVKGGVYLPLLLLLPMCIQKRPKISARLVRWIIPAIVAAVLLIAATFVKFMPMFSALFDPNNGSTSSTSLYSISYVLHNPVKTIYLLWNTVVRRSDTLLQGLLGGSLSWLNVKVNWSILVILLVILLLLANVKNDSPVHTCKTYICLSFACCGSILLVMFSMLVGYTTMKWDFVQGLQGRYLLPISPALFSLSSTEMVSLDSDHTAKVWEAMMITEILLIIQVTTIII